MNSSHNHIKLWVFEDAPEELRKLSPHGGDEEHVFLVPKGYPRDLYFIERMDPHFNDRSEHKLPDGSIVYITAH